MIVCAAKFTGGRWEEALSYMNRMKNHNIECIYGSSAPLSSKFIPLDGIYILEMDFVTHEIKGIGLVVNEAIVGEHVIHENSMFNFYKYKGQHRVDRVEWTKEELEVMEEMENILFKVCRVWRTISGLPQLPKWVRDSYGTCYKQTIGKMFARKYKRRNNSSQIKINK